MFQPQMAEAASQKSELQRRVHRSGITLGLRPHYIPRCLRTAELCQAYKFRRVKQNYTVHLSSRAFSSPDSLALAAV